MIRINQIKLNPNHSEQALLTAVKKSLCLDGNSDFTYKVVKKSIDGRHKPDIKFVYSVDVDLKGFDLQREQKLVRKINNKNIMSTQNIEYRFPDAGKKQLKQTAPPVIVGTGPAGLFCGLLLARAGFQPVLFERGADLDERTQDVESFWNGGKLNPSSNVQFGEGGAGTFSDGKLNTMIKDKTGRIAFVLKTFHEFGAPEEITYMNKPHIGTDVLHQVIKNIRQEIIRLGGKIYFHSQVTDIVTENNRICGLIINQEQRIDCELAVFAIGHSARDTFEMLKQKGVAMEPKPFAIGVRVEHPQQMIQKNAYGDAPYELPAADYKVTAQAGERGVYSFCMCPGGYVVNASSEEGRTCVNGMSYAARDSKNANSAIVVAVSPKDFGGEGDDPLCGMYFQRRLEEKAYEAGLGKIPVQTYGDFKKSRITTEFGEVTPVTKGLVRMADLNPVFPKIIRESIIEGMESFAGNIPGFNREDAVLSGVESRTSSPVRILRNEEFMANFYGLMPCGEGAGYAGGITSAAIDGIRVAEEIVTKWSL